MIILIVQQKIGKNVSFIFLVDVLQQVEESDKEVDEVKWFDLDNLPPKSDIAFDHYETIMLYKEYLNSPFPLPSYDLQ